jgi:caprin-1
LTQLDELYKLLSPSREGETNYAEELAKASDHFVNLLDGKDKPVVGTTYKDLKVLIDLIDDCGYFEHAMEEEEGQDTEFVVVNTTEIPKPDSAEVAYSPDLVNFIPVFHLFIVKYFSGKVLRKTVC